MPLHRCGGVIHAHQKRWRNDLDAYALNVRQNRFTKVYRPWREDAKRAKKWTKPSSRTNVRDLRKISPFGRNDNAPLGVPFDFLRKCFAPFARVILFRPFEISSAAPSVAQIVKPRAVIP